MTPRAKIRQLHQFIHALQLAKNKLNQQDHVWGLCKTLTRLNNEAYIRDDTAIELKRYITKTLGNHSFVELWLLANVKDFRVFRCTFFVLEEPTPKEVKAYCKRMKAYRTAWCNHMIAYFRELIVEYRKEIV